MVSTLGYGAFELRGAARGRDVTPRQADAILNSVLDSGINFIDTAPDYLQSEELIGEFIAHRRSEYYLATKCGCLVGAPPLPVGQPMPHLYTPENIIAGVHQSLTRMRTDYIDVLQFHIGPSKATLEENDAIEAVLKLKQAGKIRFIGMSATLPNIVEHLAMGVFDVFQIPYSALERGHEEIITKAGRGGAGIIVRGGAARGAVSQERQGGDAWDLWQAARLDEILDGMSRMEFILRFTFSHPDLDTNIVGTINPNHLRENLDALMKGPLEPNLYAGARRRLTEAGMTPTRLE